MPFIDVFEVGSKMWYQELEDLKCLYKMEGTDSTVEEKDFVSLIGNSFLTCSIADAVARQIFEKCASSQGDI